jgi:hypothetical protein
MVLVSLLGLLLDQYVASVLFHILDIAEDYLLTYF